MSVCLTVWFYWIPSNCTWRIYLLICLKRVLTKILYLENQPINSRFTYTFSDDRGYFEMKSSFANKKNNLLINFNIYLWKYLLNNLYIRWISFLLSLNRAHIIKSTNDDQNFTNTVGAVTNSSWIYLGISILRLQT